jgi:hypothetical protein
VSGFLTVIKVPTRDSMTSTQMKTSSRKKKAVIRVVTQCGSGKNRRSSEMLFLSVATRRHIQEYGFFKITAVIVSYLTSH